MDIVETPIFTKRVIELLSDDSYRELQAVLIQHPDVGDRIAGSGGIRKLRWIGSGKGKRGGLRVIYYWFIGRDTLLMLYIYPKNEQSDLTADQLKLLRQVVERELK